MFLPTPKDLSFLSSYLAKALTTDILNWMNFAGREVGGGGSGEAPQSEFYQPTLHQDRSQQILAKVSITHLKYF